jgi:oxygen-dependent protoporphyrinogen oxidase
MINEMLKDFPGLYVTGNAYYGIGIPDCVKMARDVSARVVKEHAQTSVGRLS